MYAYSLETIYLSLDHTDLSQTIIFLFVEWFNTSIIYLNLDVFGVMGDIGSRGGGNKYIIMYRFQA